MYNKEYILEYLDKNFGIPLYQAAKREFNDVQVVKTSWLIHSIGDNELAKTIMHDGFGNGLSKDELNKYAMTWAIGKHEEEGYSWAYKADDFLGKKRKSDYGTSILFQASGVEYFNEADNTKQVLFYNKTSKNRILIYEWDGEENKKDKFSNYHQKQNLYAVGNVNGKPLYIGYFGDVIEWCITNFNQYRGNLLTNDKILHVSDKTEEKYEEYLNRNGYGNLPNGAINKYNKWHSQEEEDDDRKNWDEILEKEYQIYLNRHKKEIDEINKNIESFIKMNPDMQNSLENLKERLMSIYGISYADFLNGFQKSHPFYIRRKPDNSYWKK